MGFTRSKITIKHSKFPCHYRRMEELFSFPTLKQQHFAAVEVGAPYMCCTSNHGRASRVSLWSHVFLPMPLKDTSLPCLLQEPCLLWCPLMSSEALVSVFCRKPGLQFQLSESQQGEQAISAFHIKVVFIRGFNSIFPVLATYHAVKAESSAYKYFLGLRISDCVCVCVLISCPFHFSFHTYWLI